jgi:hypothetical protein
MSIKDLSFELVYLQAIHEDVLFIAMLRICDNNDYEKFKDQWYLSNLLSKYPNIVVRILSVKEFDLIVE